jgi:hypothetical protein
MRAERAVSSVDGSSLAVSASWIMNSATPLGAWDAFRPKTSASVSCIRLIALVSGSAK